MPTPEVQTLVETARQAWLTGDGSAFASLFVDRGEFIAPGQWWVGRHQIHQALEDYAKAYDSVSITIRRVIQENASIVTEWHWQDREKATDKCTQAEDAIVIDLEEGRIRRWREYINVV